MTTTTLDIGEAKRRRAEARWRYARDTGVLWRRNRLMVMGTVIIAALLLVAAGAPLLATHSPYEQVLADRLHAPSGKHLFGTDGLGRDIFSRVVHGARITLMIALLQVTTFIRKYRLQIDGQWQNTWATFHYDKKRKFVGAPVWDFEIYSKEPETRGREKMMLNTADREV